MIDNNSSDHTAEVVREAKQGPLPLRRVLERNQGVSTPEIAVLSEASFEHLVYLDDDELVDKAGWKHMLRYKLPSTPIVLSVLLNHCSSKCLPNG